MNERLSEAEFRNKVTWFSFLFSLLVVWVHSYNAELYLGLTMDMARIYRIEHFIGDGIGQIAVPGFFMISGYLFYRGFTWDQLKSKWMRRIRSVLVPFILWNTIYYLGYVIGSRLPWMTDVVGKGVVGFTLPALVDAVLHYTYNYVFWYLYQLILLILLAPVLYPVLKCRWSRIALLGGLWILVALDLDLPIINEDALIYYGTAASLALEAAGVRTGGNRMSRGGSIEFGGSTESDRNTEARGILESRGTMKTALAGAALVAASVAVYQFSLWQAFIPGFILCRLLAVMGLWILVPGQLLPPPKEFMCHNFFLYATHFGFVRFINKAGAFTLQATWWEPLALYLLMPVLVLIISTLLGKILRKMTPTFWNILNGYR